MDRYSDDFSELDRRDLPTPVVSARDELESSGFEVDAVRPSRVFGQNGPVLRLVVEPLLPSRPRADIRPEEPLLLGDWDDYPSTPPSVRLDRVDFPRDLPHVNLVLTPSPVWPCLTDRPPSEWFVDRTIIDLIEQTRSWLSDAASGRLMEGDDGFEPILLPLLREHPDDGVVHIVPAGYCVASCAQ